MGDAVLFALTAAVNPTLLAATTVMLLLPNPERLMLGYWLGAMVTSIALGLVFVFSLEGSSLGSTTEHTLSPSIDLVIAGLLLVAAFVLATGPHKRFEERRSKRRKVKKPPKWQRSLRDASPAHAFVIAVVLSFPGISYLAALDRLDKLHYSTVLTVLIVIGFCLVQLILIEVPIFAFRIWPQRTAAEIENAKRWAARRGREYGAWGLALIGAALAIRGVIGLL
jgi:hypothetical protein